MSLPFVPQPPSKSLPCYPRPFLLTLPYNPPVHPVCQSIWDTCILDVLACDIALGSRPPVGHGAPRTRTVSVAPVGVTVSEGSPFSERMANWSEEQWGVVRELGPTTVHAATHLVTSLTSNGTPSLAAHPSSDGLEDQQASQRTVSIQSKQRPELHTNMHARSASSPLQTTCLFAVLVPAPRFSEDLHFLILGT